MFRDPLYVLASAACLFIATGASAATGTAPRIQSLLKSAVYDRAMNSREIMTHADLDGDHYHYYATMLVRASVKQTRAILTRYDLYSHMISYIDRVHYDPNEQTLEIEGGIWHWKMHSWLRFEQRGLNWIHYKVIDGHFTGMTGEILFEPRGEKGTLVYMGGGLTQKDWPPKLVLERGAEIVFGFTGKRMRSYIESHKTEGNSDHELKHDKDLPQPRSYL